MPKHIYHYNTHAEKRYFLGKEHHGFYDMIALNGNIVSNTPEGVAGFVATAGKDFYIDPQTHAFQHATVHLKRDVSDKEEEEVARYEFKPSIVKLARERLRGPFASVIAQDRPLTPEVFLVDDGRLRSAVIDEVCQAVANFQLETMILELDDEAKELMGDLSRLRPAFVIAPYFCLANRRWRDWLKVNIACYRRTKELFNTLPVYMSLLVSSDIVDDFGGVVEGISGVKPDGIVLWIDDQVEEMLGPSNIRRYVAFLQKLRPTTRMLYNSHGGYLSSLLCHAEFGGLLDGVAHGVNYGEHRSIVPIGGGIPMAQFYLLRAHSRLRYADAAGILLAKDWLQSVDAYRENVCKCEQCIELLTKSDGVEAAFAVYGRSNPVTITRRTGAIVRLEYPTREAKQAAARHYLYNKAREFQNIEEKSLNDLLTELSETYESISPYAGEDFIGHLPKWRESLESMRGDK